MLEGMSRIEADAYRLLAQLGATPVTRVLTAGGGAVNDKWTALRAAAIGVPVAAAAQGIYCHGAGVPGLRAGLAGLGWCLDRSAESIVNESKPSTSVMPWLHMLCRRGVLWGCAAGKGRLAAVAAAAAAGCDDATAAASAGSRCWSVSLRRSSPDVCVLWTEGRHTAGTPGQQALPQVGSNDAPFPPPAWSDPFKQIRPAATVPLPQKTLSVLTFTVCLHRKPEHERTSRPSNTTLRKALSDAHWHEFSTKCTHLP
jgi:hypothetical protein